VKGHILESLLHRKVPGGFILMELEKETPVYHTRHQSQTNISVPGKRGRCRPAWATMPALRRSLKLSRMRGFAWRFFSPPQSRGLQLFPLSPITACGCPSFL